MNLSKAAGKVVDGRSGGTKIPLLQTALKRSVGRGTRGNHWSGPFGNLSLIMMLARPGPFAVPKPPSSGAGGLFL